MDGPSPGTIRPSLHLRIHDSVNAAFAIEGTKFIMAKVANGSNCLGHGALKSLENAAVRASKPRVDPKVPSTVANRVCVPIVTVGRKARIAEGIFPSRPPSLFGDVIPKATFLRPALDDILVYAAG